MPIKFRRPGEKNSLFLFLAAVVLGWFCRGACAQDGYFDEELKIILKDYNSQTEELASLRGEYKRLQDDSDKKMKEYEARLKLLGESQREKSSLELKLKELQSQQGLWHKQSQQLSQSIQQLSGIVRERDNAVESLKQANQELKKKQDEYALKVDGYEERLKKLKQIENERISLEDKLKGLQSQQVNWQAQSRQLSQSIEKLSAAVEEKDTAVRELKQGRESVLKSLEEARQKAKDYESRIKNIEQIEKEKDSLGAKLKDAQARLEDSRNQGGEFSQSLKQLNKALEDKERIIQSLTQAKSDLEKKREAADSSIARMQQEGKGLSEGLEKLNKIIQDKDRGLQEFKRRQEELLKDQIATRARVEGYELKLKQLEQLQKEKTLLLAQSQGLKSQQSSWQEQVQQLNVSVSQLTSLLQEKDKALQELKKAEGGLLQRLSAAEAKSAEIIREKGGIQEALKGKGSDYDAGLKEIERLKKDKADLELKIKGLQEKEISSTSLVQGLRQAQAELLKKHTDNLWQIKDYQDKSRLLDADKQKSGAQISALKAELEKYSRQKEELLKSIQDRDKDIRELRYSQNELSKKQAEYSKDLTLSQGQISKLRKTEEEKIKLETALQGLKAQKEALEKNSDELSASLRQSIEAIKEKDKALEGLQGAQSALLLKQDDLLTRLKDYENKASSAQADGSILKKKAEELELRYNLLSDKNKQLNDSIARHKTLGLENDKVIQELRRSQIELLQGQNQANLKIKDYELKLKVLEKLQNDFLSLDSNYKNLLNTQISSESENQQLSASLENSSKSIREKESLIEELSRFKAGLELAQEEGLSRIKRLENEISIISGERDGLAKKANEQLNSLESLRQQNQQLSAALEQLSASLQDKDKAALELKRQHQDSLGQEDKLKIKLKGYEYKISQIGQLEKDKSSLERGLKELNQEKGKLELRGQQQLNSIAELERSVSAFNQKQKDLLAKQGELNLLVKDYEDRIAFIQGEKAALQTQLKDFKFNEQISKSKLEELNTLLQSKERLIVEARQKVKESSGKQDDYSLQLQDYQIRLSRLENENASLKEQLQKIRGKESTWEGKISEFESILKEKDKAIGGLKQYQEEIINQSQSQQGNLREMETVLSQLQRKNKILLGDNKMLKKKVAEYPGKFSKLAVLKDRLVKDNSVLHYNLGVFHIQKQEYNEAISEFEKVLDLNPADSATHYNLAIIYAEYLANRPKAILHFKRYLLNAGKGDKDVERANKYIMTWEKWEEGK